MTNLTFNHSIWGLWSYIWKIVCLLLLFLPFNFNGLRAIWFLIVIFLILDADKRKSFFENPIKRFLIAHFITFTIIIFSFSYIPVVKSLGCKRAFQPVKIAAILILLFIFFRWYFNFLSLLYIILSTLSKGRYQVWLYYFWPGIRKISRILHWYLITNNFTFRYSSR